MPAAVALFALSAICAALVSCSGQHGPYRTQSTIELRTRSVSFVDDASPASFESVDPGQVIRSFTMRLSLTPYIPSSEDTLLEVPGIMKLVLRQHDPSVWNPQNYPACPMPDGTVPVLEASVSLHSEVTPGEIRDMVVGIPLALLDDPLAVHEIVLDFSDVRWSMYVDGILYDNDFTLGYPVSSGQGCSVRSPQVGDVSLWLPGLEAVPGEVPGNVGKFGERASEGIQYWIPPFYNSWVGDVAAIWHDGCYHLFYLFDRRGHGSKFGRGGHYFEHLSTADFKTWKEHEAATPIEEQWETFGTGTPFAKDDKLYLSYGLHTTRIYPEESTNLPEQKEYLKGHGETGCFPYDTLDGKVPAGTTWAFSEDGGKTFVKSRMTVHPCENPSIYTDAEGNLSMLANYRAKGTWVSDRLEGGWRCIDPDFPLGGDCTFPFTWGGYDYVVGGFVSMWNRPAGKEDAPWHDMVAASEDCYNGISVPSVTPIPGDRMIMAGWLKMRNWAGALVIYELVQHPDGSLGSKWMDEIVPVTGRKLFGKRNIADGEGFVAGAPSFMLSFEVETEEGKEPHCSVGFMPEEGGEPCYLGIDNPGCRAQYSSAPDSKERTLREGCHVANAGNYAVEKGMDLDGPFRVRIAVRTDPRFNGSIIDTEIAGEKTLVTFRKGLEVKDLVFSLDGCRISRVDCHEIE